MSVNEVHHEGKADRAQIVSELRLTQIAIEKSKSAFYRLNPEGMVQYANDYACQSLGYTKEELVGMHVWDFDPDFPAEAWSPMWAKLKQTGIIYIESRHKRKDGSVFPIAATGNYICHDDEEYSFTFVQDITERKLAEASLQQAKSLLRTTLDSTFEGILMVAQDGRVLAINKRFIDLWHLPEEICASGEDAKLLAYVLGQLTDPESFMSEVRRLYDSDEEAEDILYFKDGRVFSRFSRALVVDGQRGRIWYFNDITEKKRTEEELQRHRLHLEDLVEARTLELKAAKESAEAANLAKSQFLTRMSHELRTPLNAILGFAELMQGCGDSVTIGEERESIDNITKAGWHLLGIINDLLDLSAIEIHKLEVYPENVELAPSILDCLQTIAPLALDRLITVNHALGKVRGLYVQADRQRLKQVLLNLLTNAVKYNRTRGTIDVVCERLPSDRIRILVSDTGAGIPTEDLASLFDPFNRLHKKYESDGAGIGLAIAKDLVELMEGSIGVESVPEQGSTFWIELKQSTQAAPPIVAEEQKSDTAAEHPAKRVKLLYIEDSPSHVKLMQHIVKNMGNIELITAHTPALGLQLAQAHGPDLIICDICLPGMDGFAVLEQLKADARTRDIPVFALSANAMPAQVEAGLLAGFRRYLTKPISISHFKKALNELLEDEAALHGSGGS